MIEYETISCQCTLSIDRVKWNLTFKINRNQYNQILNLYSYWKKKVEYFSRPNNCKPKTRFNYCQKIFLYKISHWKNICENLSNTLDNREFANFDPDLKYYYETARKISRLSLRRKSSGIKRAKIFSFFGRPSGANKPAKPRRIPNIKK